ncbi:MAG: hypothetical protein QNL91_09430 [Candidatus Krumholzibacteria bacterium]|nr:hypothetical protein [Candidatus Krumholzibacteria bacterium]
MKNTFVCPHCQGVLNPNVKILLVAVANRRKGMILLSPQPGNYKTFCDDSLLDAFKEGQTITFSCPMCTTDLTAEGNPKFARMELHVTGHKPRRVDFSRIFGAQATFVIDGNEVTAYGEDAEDFDPTNFFGA